jgi:hypothetical protein
LAIDYGEIRDEMRSVNERRDRLNILFMLNSHALHAFSVGARISSEEPKFSRTVYSQFTAVIPAERSDGNVVKAGIHLSAGALVEPWIPAFAGMTFNI